MAAGKGKNIIGQQEGSKYTVGANGQGTGCQTFGLVQVLQEPVFNVSNLFNTGDIFLSDFRQADRGTGTVKNRAANAFFHFFYHGTQGRLGNEQLFCRPGKAHFLIYSINILHVTEHPLKTSGNIKIKHSHSIT